MPIPESTGKGSLPPGEHEATWEELVARTGFNNHRETLLAGLEGALTELKRAGATRVYIDGSFVTNKPYPNDYDVCYDIADTDLPNLPAGLDVTAMRAPRQIMKAHFLGELLPAHFSAVMNPTRETYREFFQHDRDGEPRGVVVIDLRSW